MKPKQTYEQRIDEALNALQTVKNVLKKKSDLQDGISKLTSQLEELKELKATKSEELSQIRNEIQEQIMRHRQLNENCKTLADQIENANGNLCKALSLDGAHTFNELREIAAKTQVAEDKTVENILVSVEDGQRMGMTYARYPARFRAGVFQIESASALKPGYAIIVMRAHGKTHMKMIKPA